MSDTFESLRQAPQFRSEGGRLDDSVAQRVREELGLNSMWKNLFLIGCAFVAVFASAQEPFVANYDESKVPEYSLPDPLTTKSGETVSDPQTWTNTRRPEVLRLFQTQVYGRAPQPCEIKHSLISTKVDAIGGKAIRREVDLFFGTSADATSMRMLIYTPKATTSPSPAFIGLNFKGNHTVESDPAINLSRSWVRDQPGLAINNRATEAARGVSASRWPVELIIDRGYALVTIYYGDIDPDFDDGFKNGIHRTLQSKVESIPQGERWGSIATWAYGLSRAVDYLETDSTIDASRIAVVGHSRLGKTALWAGASDQRFAMVLSNDSGCGGAALSRRAIGETTARINRVFPHWFCDNYQQYDNNENACPVDQHQLVALIAPRPVYIASASEDRWADPKGEFLSAFHADPVYRLLGTNGLGGASPPQEMPDADSPISDGTIGYHLRAGKHDITTYDWTQYLNFADRHLK